ncbi:hypothetical protein GJ496_010950 [Pomphorhynchus laevis]|nr:hypothetical protein GJ496_010950 [Pomphorhynchus laevis]
MTTSNDDSSMVKVEDDVVITPPEQLSFSSIMKQCSKLENEYLVMNIAQAMNEFNYLQSTANQFIYSLVPYEIEMIRKKLKALESKLQSEKRKLLVKPMIFQRQDMFTKPTDLSDDKQPEDGNNSDDNYQLNTNTTDNEKQLEDQQEMFNYRIMNQSGVNRKINDLEEKSILSIENSCQSSFTINAVKNQGIFVYSASYNARI